MGRAKKGVVVAVNVVVLLAVLAVVVSTVVCAEMRLPPCRGAQAGASALQHFVARFDSIPL